MAFFQCDFFSTALCFNTSVNIIIPTAGGAEAGADGLPEGRKYPVIYLFHGAYGDHSDWQRLTRIEQYARQHKLAVVMPAASNSFYLDMPYGSGYLSYISRELPDFIRKNFPVSSLRAYNFTAGLSMGGYGAIRAALARPDLFSAAISLSGAIDFPALKNRGSEGEPRAWRAMFEDSDGYRARDADLAYIAKGLAASGQPLPRLFISCGTEDFLYVINQSACRKFRALGMDVRYEEHPGAHEWAYWDEHIRRGIEWLKLPGTSVDA